MRLLIGRLLLWFIDPVRAQRMSHFLAQMKKEDERHERWWQARREAARRWSGPASSVTTPAEAALPLPGDRATRRPSE